MAETQSAFRPCVLLLQDALIDLISFGQGYPLGKARAATTQGATSLQRTATHVGEGGGAAPLARAEDDDALAATLLVLAGTANE